MKHLLRARCVHIHALFPYQTHTDSSSKGGIFTAVFQMCRAALRELGWLIPAGLGLEADLTGRERALSPTPGCPPRAQHASFQGVEKETLGPFTGFPCA